MLRDRALQFLRFAVVGTVSNLVAYLLYLLLTNVGMEPKLAMTIVYIAGVLQTFAFNRKWTFRHNGVFRPTILRYCLVYFAGYLVNLTAIVLLVDQAHFNHQLVQGMMIVVLAGSLFLAQKYWVFSPNFTSSRQ